MKKFNIGDKVRVLRDGNNASTVARELDLPYRGVYDLLNWKRCTFTIGGDYKPIVFEHDPKIYGAYPLMWRKKLRGYVYNNALELVK